MKKIVFVKDMKNDDDVQQIKKFLELIDIEYTISLNSETVIVHGDNDELYAAKQAIAQAGYTVL